MLSRRTLFACIHGQALWIGPPRTRPESGNPITFIVSEFTRIWMHQGSPIVLCGPFPRLVGLLWVMAGIARFDFIYWEIHEVSAQCRRVGRLGECLGAKSGIGGRVGWVTPAGQQMSINKCLRVAGPRRSSTAGSRGAADVLEDHDLQISSGHSPVGQGAVALTDP